MPPSPEQRRKSLTQSGPSRHRKGAASLAAGNQAGSLQSILRDAARSQADGNTQLTSIADELDAPTSSSSTYLATLTTQPLESLQSQPELLASSSSRLEDQLAALCSRQIGPLVRVHEVTSSLPLTLQSIQGHLSTLLETALPRLEKVASSVQTRSEPVLSRRSQAKQLLQAHTTSLAELLDLPDLISSCIRGGHCSEALQLGSHIAQLARPSSELGGGAALRALRNQAWFSLAAMRASLLHGLENKSLRLDSAERAISTLRKLRDLDLLREPSASSSSSASSGLGLTEEQLCLAFLRARSNLLRSLLASPIARQKQYRSTQQVVAAHLEGFLEIWSEGLEFTIKVVRALFQQEPPIQRLLSAFVNLNTSWLQEELAIQLPKLVAQLDSLSDGRPESISAKSMATTAYEVTSTLRSLHQQLSDIVQITSHLGFNLRPLLTGPQRFDLETIVLPVFQLSTDRAVALFKERITASSSYAASSWLVEASQYDDAVSDASSSTNGVRSDDPQELSSYPPLASLLNDLIIGLNALQSYAPASQRSKCLHILDDALMQSSQLLLSYAEALHRDRSLKNSGLVLPTVEDMDDGSQAERQAGAERLLAASALDRASGVLIPYCRSSLWNLVFKSSSPLPRLDSNLIDSMSSWSQQARLDWRNDQERRLAMAEQRRTERLAAEAERARLEEEERIKAQKQAERLRIEEEERQRVEAERQRKEAEEEARRRAEQEALEREAAEKARLEAIERAKREAEEQRIAAAEARKRRLEEQERFRKEQEERQRVEDERLRLEREEVARKRREADAARDEEVRASQITSPEGSVSAQEEPTQPTDTAVEAEPVATSGVGISNKAPTQEGSPISTEKASTEKTGEPIPAADALAAPTTTQSEAVPQAPSEPTIAPPTSTETSSTTPSNGPAAIVAAQDTVVESGGITPPGTRTPTPAVLAYRKMTLAEKLRARQEERERQAALARAVQQQKEEEQV